MSSQRFLVTGGAGFIGSTIVRKLLERGDQVRVLDNFSTGRIENIADIQSRIELINGDICDMKTVREAVAGVDIVIHQAALASVQKSIADPISSYQVNIGGTLNILWAAVELKAKKFVMASSASVYGESPVLPKIETLPPEPLSPYAVTKLVGEHYCNVFWNLYKLPTVALRYFNIFGPRQDPKGDYAPVIPIFLTKLLNGETPTIYGDGEQSRDFVYVENAADANLLAASNDAMNGGVFNVGSGTVYSLNQIAAKMNSILGTQITPHHAPPRAGDIRHSYSSSSLIQSHGFKLAIDFDEGLRRTVEFYKRA